MVAVRETMEVSCKNTLTHLARRVHRDVERGGGHLVAEFKSAIQGAQVNVSSFLNSSEVDSIYWLDLGIYIYISKVSTFISLVPPLLHLPTLP